MEREGASHLYSPLGLVGLDGGHLVALALPQLLQVGHHITEGDDAHHGHAVLGLQLLDGGEVGVLAALHAVQGNEHPAKRGPLPVDEGDGLADGRACVCVCVCVCVCM